MRRLLLATLALAAATTGCGGGSGGSAGDRGAATPPPWVRVGAGPVGIAADRDGTVWVVNAGDSTLSHVIGRAAHREPHVGDTPLRVAVDPSTGSGTVGLWVTSFGDGRLLRLDAKTGSVTGSAAVGDGAEGVATGFGSVWVVAQDAGRLVQLRASDRRVQRRIDIGDGARLVATDSAHVWVSQFAEGLVLRVDPRTGRVTRSGRVCAHPQGLLPLPDRVWVTCTSTDEVVALDPASLAVVDTVHVPGQPDPVVAGPHGEVVVVAEDGPTVHVLDPRDHHVRATYRLGTAVALDDEANIDAAVTEDGRLWVTSYREGRVYYRDLS